MYIVSMSCHGISLKCRAFSRVIFVRFIVAMMSVNIRKKIEKLGVQSRRQGSVKLEKLGLRLFSEYSGYDSPLYFRIIVF